MGVHTLRGGFLKVQLCLARASFILWQPSSGHQQDR